MKYEASEPLGYRPAEAARALGIGKTSIYALVKAGKLELIQLGPRTSVITTASMRALIQGRADAATIKGGAA